MPLKAAIVTLASITLTSQAWAQETPPPCYGVPEVSATGALAAIVAVAALGVAFFERRQRA
jgi:hypothetical protein